jgi:hypothetical protein
MKPGRYQQLRGLVRNRLPYSLRDYQQLQDLVITKVLAARKASISKQILIIKEFVLIVEQIEHQLLPIPELEIKH